MDRKWEYKIESLYEWSESDAASILEDLGSKGWELVHVSASLRTYFFKRPYGES